MNSPHITIVSPNLQDIDKSNIAGIMKDLKAELKLVNTFTELYPLLSDQQFTTNLICINIESLYEKGNIEAWNNINALSTIIKSTVCRPSGTGIPTKRQVSIAVCANKNSNINHIKDFLSMNELCIGIFPKSDPFTKEDQHAATVAFLDGIKHIPEFFSNKIKNKKKQTETDPCQLTPRQKQIFDLIIHRGASNKAIARILNISESTVKLHMTAILKKNSVRNRTQLAVFSKNYELE
jgi:DNA-binding CsgD family transcriptional regulator